MPLPAGGDVLWPPEHCGPINTEYATWAAWWSGNADQLATIYGATSGSQDTSGFCRRFTNSRRTYYGSSARCDYSGNRCGACQ